jgi:hypothetical protein
VAQKRKRVMGGNLRSRQQMPVLTASAGRRWRWLQAGALAVLFFGLLPQLVYLGHYGPGHEEINSPQEAAEHAWHCHLGPFTCADSGGKVAVAPPVAPVLILAARTLFLLLTRETTPRPQLLPQRPLQPPRAARAYT